MLLVLIHLKSLVPNYVASLTTGKISSTKLSRNTLMESEKHRVRNQFFWSLNQNNINPIVLKISLFTDSQRHAFHSLPLLQVRFRRWRSQSEVFCSMTRAWLSNCFCLLWKCWDWKVQEVVTSFDSFKFCNTILSAAADAIFSVKTSSEKSTFRPTIRWKES